MIYYGIAFEDADVLDFTTDFLAGVRANYFSNNENLKSEVSYVKVKGFGYTFSHNIEKGLYMTWELSRKYERGFSSGKGQLLQKSKQVDLNCYVVETYNKLGFVSKKIYFDNNHKWIKTEYFRSNDDVLVCVLRPAEDSNENVLEKIQYVSNDTLVTNLYPVYEMPEDSNYQVVAYTDKGFVYYKPDASKSETKIINTKNKRLEDSEFVNTLKSFDEYNDNDVTADVVPEEVNLQPELHSLKNNDGFNFELSHFTEEFQGEKLSIYKTDNIIITDGSVAETSDKISDNNTSFQSATELINNAKVFEIDELSDVSDEKSANDFMDEINLKALDDNVGYSPVDNTQKILDELELLISGMDDKISAFEQASIEESQQSDTTSTDDLLDTTETKAENVPESDIADESILKILSDAQTTENEQQEIDIIDKIMQDYNANNSTFEPENDINIADNNTLDSNVDSVDEELSLTEEILPEVNAETPKEVPDKFIKSKGENYGFFGELVDGKRQGHGRTVTSEGYTAYEGDFVDDKRNGFGAFYYKNGDINYVGNWKNNKRQGFGVGFRNFDFTAHIGKWDNNQPQGIGARFDKNGNFVFLGNYVDGKKQGFGISVDENNNYIVSRFKDDKVVTSVLLQDIFPEFE